FCIGRIQLDVLLCARARRGRPRNRRQPPPRPAAREEHDACHEPGEGARMIGAPSPLTLATKKTRSAIRPAGCGVFVPSTISAARGESPAAFGRRCIPAPTPTRWETRVGGPGADCVAPPSNIPDIAPHRAQDARWGPRSAVVAPLRRGPHGADRAPWGGSAGRLAALGATPDFHHGLLADCEVER